MQFLLNSGSDISLIRLDVAKQFCISYTPVRIRATSANGAHIKIIGIAHEQVELGGQRVPITLYVAALLSDRAILGANELAQFSTLLVHYGGSMPPLYSGCTMVVQCHPYIAAALWWFNAAPACSGCTMVVQCCPCM